jgi:hypothetical protein
VGPLHVPPSTPSQHAPVPRLRRRARRRRFPLATADNLSVGAVELQRGRCSSMCISMTNLRGFAAASAPPPASASSLEENMERVSVAASMGFGSGVVETGDPTTGWDSSAAKECSFVHGVQRRRRKRDTIIKPRGEVGDRRWPVEPTRLAVVPPGHLLGGVERA